MLTTSRVSIAAGFWHHALVSFDMSSGCGTTATGAAISFDNVCKFWMAIDDTNYNARYLGPFQYSVFHDSGLGGPYSGASDPNGIVSAWSLWYGASPVGATPVSFAAGNLPAAGLPIGLPGDSRVAPKIYNVELADVQMFTGVTLDTSVLLNRRAFVTSEGVPEDPATAASLLGKSPEIYFHKSSDWINGRNQGTAGSFSSTGTISNYTPGPAIGS
jgi:hypothetical protein